MPGQKGFLLTINDERVPSSLRLRMDYELLTLMQLDHFKLCKYNWKLGWSNSEGDSDRFLISIISHDRGMRVTLA